jgi:hypothetical protein
MEVAGWSVDRKQEVARSLDVKSLKEESQQQPAAATVPVVVARSLRWEQGSVSVLALLVSRRSCELAPSQHRHDQRALTRGAGATWSSHQFGFKAG